MSKSDANGSNTVFTFSSRLKLCYVSFAIGCLFLVTSCSTPTTLSISSMPILASWLNLALQPEMTGEETTETAGEGTKDTSTDTKGTREGGDWLRSLLSAIGPAVGLITAVIVRVRNRRGTLSEVTERIPIALAIDIPLSTEGESRNPTQRRTRQRRRVRWRSILLLIRCVATSPVEVFYAGHPQAEQTPG